MIGSAVALFLSAPRQAAATKAAEPRKASRRLMVSIFVLVKERLSMAKMPEAGEDHCQAMLVTGRNRVGIAHGAARLNDCSNAGPGGLVHVVAKRKERV